MDIAQVQAFIEAERRGSFRKAAKAMFLSQPSLSSRIRTLEKELGAELFHRRGSGVVLTDMGRVFLPYARRAMESLGEARQVVATAQNAAGGIVTIAATRQVGTYTLPEILGRLRDEHPDVGASVTVSKPSQVLQMVVDGQVQLGLSRGLVHPQVDTRRLFDEDLVLIVHPGHPFTARGDVTIRDVATEPLVLYDTDSSDSLLIEQVCAEAGVVPRVEMRLEGVEAAKRMVEKGLGISFVPRSALGREVELGSIRTVPLGPEHRMVLPTCVLIRRSKRYPDTVRSILGVLQAMYGTWPVSGTSRGRGRRFETGGGRRGRDALVQLDKQWPG